MREFKKNIWIPFIHLAFTVAILIGYVKCVFKAIECNWDPIGKAEIIYTAGIFSGLGCIIGYLDIEDK